MSALIALFKLLLKVKEVIPMDLTTIAGIAGLCAVAYFGRGYLVPVLTKLKGVLAAVPSPTKGGDAVPGTVYPLPPPVPFDARADALAGAVRAADYLKANGDHDAAACIAGKLSAIVLGIDTPVVVPPIPPAVEVPA